MKLFIAYTLTILAFIICFVIECEAQDTTWVEESFECIHPKGWYESKHIVPALSIIHAVSDGYTTYYQMKDRMLFKQNGNYKPYNKNWHTAQGVTLGLSFTVAIFSALKNQDDWWDYGKDGLLFSAIRWMVRDGIYNSLNGNPFFHQSNSTTATLEPFGTWYVKLSYLALAIIVYYIL